jgi:curli biogenesis system outer membrane secretion channel CsgG
MRNDVESRMKITTVLSLLTLTVLPGCTVLGFRDSHKYERPTVAVVAFENRARPPRNWLLGEGVADLLANALFKTGRFRVLERENIDDVLIEQEFQGTGRTRREGRVSPNRLKNARYLVRGTITEFTHVQRLGVDLAVGPLRFGGGGERAVVSIALKLIDVESGEILFTKVLDGDVHTRGTDIRIYSNLTLGSSNFSQTPLGEALGNALDEAVESIDASVGRKPWHPVIASVDKERIVITGGEDRRVPIGSKWQVRVAGEPIRDPETGDVLGRHPGRAVGSLIVVSVEDRFSVAEIVRGSGFERGQRLYLVEPEPLESR